MLNIRYSFIFLVLFASVFSQAAEKVSLKSQSIKILQKYSKAPEVVLDIMKTDMKKTLGTKTDVQGTLNYSQGKIFYVVEKPNKVEIIFNKKVWLIEYPDLELDPEGNRKVTVFDSNKVVFIKKMSELLSKPESALTKKTTYDSKENQITISLPDSKEQVVKDLKVVLNKKDQTIDTISFVDDIGTETTVKVNKTTFEKKSNSKKYSYKKQKSDETIKQ